MTLKRARIFLVSVVFATMSSGWLQGGESKFGTIDRGFATLTLSNPSEFARADESTRVSFSELGLLEQQALNVAVTEGQTRLPSQVIDFDGDGTMDSLVFLADFEPAQTRSLRVRDAGATTADFEKRTQAEVSIKEGGQWEDKIYVGGNFVNVDAVTPPPQYTDHSEFIRYEGPGIESDLVGYRVYLDWRNGFDIFGKKTNDMVLQGVGLDDYEAYHHMADWGMDVLKVGDAVGMGGYGFWNGEKVLRVADVQQRSVRVLDNGPAFSQLEILYQGWNINHTVLDLRARLSMSAGSRLVHTRLSLSDELKNIAVGIVKHPGTMLLQGDLEISGHAWTYVASWGKQSLNDDQLGMMLLFKRQVRSKQTEDEHNYVSILQPQNGELEYYFGAVWEQEPGGVSTKAEFVKLLEREAEKLTLPLRMQLKTAKSAMAKSDPMNAETALAWGTRLAESEISRYGDSLSYDGFDLIGNRGSAWRYTTGLLAQSMDDLTLAGSDEKFAEYAKATLDSYITDEGEIRTYDPKEFNIDKINSGKMLLRLYERYGDEKYLEAAGALRAQLADHPRTSEGAFWHKEKYPWQLWLDGVYMGMPFLAHYSLLAEDEEGLEEAVNEFLVSRRHLRDAETGLYYHAWDEKKQQNWADPETGLSRYFWSRGMGWYAMALVDILDLIPEERGDLREPLIVIVQEIADTLIEFRSEAGNWYQITDKPDATGNYLEASGSSMFVYMLAKAVNKGYISKDKKEVVVGAYKDLVEQFINVETDGTVSLMNVCAVAGLGFGRDGGYAYYMSEPVMSNDPKGTAPFIMAGIQVSQMLK